MTTKLHIKFTTSKSYQIKIRKVAKAKERFLKPLAQKMLQDETLIDWEDLRKQHTYL